MRAHMPTFTAALHAEDPQSPGKYYYRIMLRSAERQSAAQKKHLIETVTRLAREEFPEAEVTGFFVLLTNLIQSILRDQWLAFLVSTGGIALCVLVAFRRLRYAAIAMVPNVLPIMTVTGVMGWLGFKINMGAAMIAAVSMGLSVDSSIHYIQAFLRARRSGKSVAEAIADVQQTVGYAMILSTFALVAGFAVLATSEFVPDDLLRRAGQPGHAGRPGGKSGDLAAAAVAGQLAGTASGTAARLRRRHGSKIA